MSATRAVGTTADEVEALDDRYGRRSPRRTRGILAAIAAALLVAGTAWYFWANPITGAATLEWSDLTHSIDSPSQVTATWRLVAPAGTAVSCAVTAHGPSSAIVGWLVVDVPPSTETVRDLTQSIRTSERASNGFVYGCWLT